MGPRWYRLRAVRSRERVIHFAIRVAAGISLLITLGIVVILLSQSILFFGSTEVTLRSFFFDTVWQPLIGRFGILPLLNATIMTSLIAVLTAMPVGLCVAIYLSEYAGERSRAILKPTLEILAGIPTVVYGYFAIAFITPLLRVLFGIFDENIVQPYNTAAAGLAIGILILPLIISLIEDALSAIPNSLREAAYGLGANKLQTSLQVVVPAAASGIVAGFILALSRAIGETMVVALAAGAGPNFTFNPLKGAETITGYIVRISGGDIGYNTPDYNSIFALALVLFVATLVLNLISRRVVNYFRESYNE